jgi:hypothetical protein
VGRPVKILSACGLLFFVFAVTAAATSTLPPPPNIRITNIPQLNNEEQVWICPTDSNVIIANWRDFRAGYRQIGIGRSTDGGQTWVDSLIPVSMQYFLFDSRQSDPTLTADQYGNFYMSVLDYIPNAASASVISFYRSTDKGVSWTGPVPNVQPGDFFEDKQFITVDRTGGLHDGNLYCSWTRFNNPTRILLVRSTDGAQSFDDTVTVGPVQSSTWCGTVDAGQFSIPVVDAAGKLHVFWQGFALDSGSCSGYSAIKQAVSTNGGVTFTAPAPVLAVSGYTTADGGIATYSQPAADADITGGPFDGNLYIAFTNVGPEDVAGNSDVDFIRSTDGGVTWSDRIMINDDAETELIDNFHPWLIVNEEGVIAVVFYDQRFNGPTYFLFDCLAACSFDGGLTFTSNQRISDVSSSPSNLKGSLSEPYTIDEHGFEAPVPAAPRAGLIGEYIGVTAYHDKINAVWTDSRDGNSEVYTANWYLQPMDPRLITPSDSLVTQDVSDFSWATSWKQDQDRYRFELATDIDFTSVVVSDLPDTPAVALSSQLPEGMYYWRVKTFTTAFDDSSAYSPVRWFYLDRTPPAVPLLLYPPDGTIDNVALPTFEWMEDSSEAMPTYTFEVATDPAFGAGDILESASGLDLWSYTVTDSLPDGVPVYWRVTITDMAGNSTVSPVREYTFLDFVCGDLNGSGTVNISDISYLVDYLFRGGPAPVLDAAANMDGSPGLTVSDLSYVVDFLFRGGPAPVC